MQSFTYKGLEFKPLRQLVGKESEFHVISRKISDPGLTPKNWNWNKFYEEAEKHGARGIDLFEVNGRVVIPGEHYLFAYNGK